MKKQIGSGKVFLILFAGLFLLNIAIFIPTFIRKAEERQVFLDLPSTDLSSLTIGGLKLGDMVSRLPEGIIEVSCKSGESISLYDSERQISPSMVVYIRSEPSNIHYKGAVLEDYNACRAAFGKHYILEKSEDENDCEQSVIYLDHEHDMQVTLRTYGSGGVRIELAPIEDRIRHMVSFPAYTQVDFLIFVPSLTPYIYGELLEDQELPALIDFIAIPLIVSAALLPFVNLIRYRKRSWAIASLLVVFYFLLGHFVMLPMMMSV